MNPTEARHAYHQWWYCPRCGDVCRTLTEHPLLELTHKCWGKPERTECHPLKYGPTTQALDAVHCFSIACSEHNRARPYIGPDGWSEWAPPERHAAELCPVCGAALSNIVRDGDRVRCRGCTWVRRGGTWNELLEAPNED